MSDERISVVDLPAHLGPRWTRYRRFAGIPDQPIVHLLRSTDGGVLSRQLTEHLGTATVPHAALDVDAEPADRNRARSVQIRTLLDNAVVQLRGHASWKRIGRLRFPRYALLSWLLKKNLQPPQPNQETDLNTKELLRDYLRIRRPWQHAEPWASAAGQLHWTAALALFLVSLVPGLRYLLWVHFGRAPRWFMRQHYLTPREKDADFPGFVQRLITTPSEHENADEVRKLLVHAFLADLADAYTRRRPAKDCYPVLLLNGLQPGTIGETLVRLLNDVRNETGARDPLLVLAVGPQPLQDGAAPKELGSLDNWEKGLQAARRRRSPTAWYVSLRLSDGPAGSDDNLLGRTALPLKRSTALRFLPAIAAALLVVGSASWYSVDRLNHCDLLWSWQNRDLWSEDGQCVGISDGTYLFRSTIPAELQTPERIAQQDELTQLQELLARQNLEAKRAFDQNKKLPYVTVIYFSTLTIPDIDSSTLAGVKEELRGLANAQLAARNSGVPMRILLANAGPAMRYGPEVADQIAELAAHPSDAPVVGVVGLGGSWTATEESIRRLDRAGLPMVGTITSADNLPEASKLYHQVGPNNQREAAVAAAYLRNDKTDPSGNRRRPDGVTVYFTPGDTYSENLAEDLRLQLEREVTRFRKEGRNPNGVRDIPCGPSETAFFAGRADDLGIFLQAVRENCKTPDNYPHLMAGDDATKFKLNQEMAHHQGVTIDFVSFNEAPDHDRNGIPDQNTALAGRELLASDAIMLLQYAVKNIGAEYNDIPLSGATIWRGIAEINGDDFLPGVSGEIDFGTARGQIPQDKAIYILRMRSGATTGMEYVQACGAGVVQFGTCP